MSYSTFGAIHATPSQPEETSYLSQSHRLCLYTLTPQSTLFNTIKIVVLWVFVPRLEPRSPLGTPRRFCQCEHEPVTRARRHRAALTAGPAGKRGAAK